MRSTLDPFQLLLFFIAGWMNQHQQRAVEYLLEENRVLREHLALGESDSPMTSVAAWR